MADILSAYIAQERGRDFVWGYENSDCMLFVAGWVALVSGLDFGATWRGLYSDEAGAKALIKARGGLVAVMTAALSAPCHAVPRRGDVGLWASPHGLTGMIATGGAWVMRHEQRGIITARLNLKFVWPVGLKEVADNAGRN